MKLNFIAAGTLALFATFSAHAGATPTVVNLGSLAPQTYKLPSKAIAVGDFAYDFTFTTTSDSYFSSVGGDALTIKFLGATNYLTSFNATIDGHSFTSYISSPSNIGPFNAVANSVSFAIDSGNPLILATGVTHTLSVTGFSNKATALNGNFYLGGVPVAAVPEPETYALMLAGLGAIGAVLRRRKIAA